MNPELFPRSHLLIGAFLYGAGTLAAAGCGLAAYQGQGPWSPALAGILCLLSVLFFKYHFVRDFPTSAEVIQDFLIPVILAASVRADVHIWQAPAAWSDLLALTGLGAALFCILYISAILYTLAITGRHPQPLAGVTILLIPYLFNGILLVGTPGLIRGIGAAVTLGLGASQDILSILGRAVVLMVLNEAAAACICLNVSHRMIRGNRIHGLLLLSAVAASLTPEVASLGSGASVSSLPAILAVPVALCAAVLSQAGLWGQVFLITGMFMDAIHAKNPTWYWDLEHYRSGFTKGAVYGLVFMAVIHGMAIVLGLKACMSFLLDHPLAASVLIGAAVFPLVKTILETFDGSERFFQRVYSNYLDWISYLRGLVIGATVGWGLSAGLSGAEGFERFLLGLVAGAAAYAGVDLMHDALEIALGKRLRFQSWRVYALAAGLGAGVGGALAWYFDGVQFRSVMDKFFKYATLHYPAAGLVVEDYVIYPLCSRWGAMNLGQTIGGVRLFYNEALSGVVNWSLAAPLFSINLTVLTALFRRSSAPLRELFTGKGLAVLMEQTVRVLRWGLWMAPVIYSFLRISADPTWYNQDGAIRTVVAALKAWGLDPGAFRSWSLNTFLFLLVYDWFRVLIYLDHMGLRVATLVNLSFVGADMLDEKAARAIGHSGRTRCIPEGLRRFGTWAPLLIPFYLPRGAEWDYVWSRSAALYQELPPDSWPAVYYVAGAFVVVTLCLGAFTAMGRFRGLQRGGASVRPHAGSKHVVYKEKSHMLTNGVYTVEVTSDGRGYSRVFSTVRKGFELDITRRPDDPLQVRGKFFYLTDRDGSAADPKNLWSIGFNPVRKEASDYKFIRTGHLSLLMTNTYGGIRAEARLSLDPLDPVEHWQVVLYNLEDRPRHLELLTYQEFGLNNTDAYRRHPFFNHLHAGTRFIRPMNAILCGNRLLKAAKRDPSRRRMTGETAFHAVKEAPAAGVTLLGYEDSRIRFIHKGTLSPPAVMTGGMRKPDDEGLLYTFDPIASFLLRVDLAPLSLTEVSFVDGYGPNEGQALELLGRHLGLPLRKDFRTWNAFLRTRERKDVGSGPSYAFSAQGDELSVGWDTPRPWAHIMANTLGYGSLVTNDGSAYSFMGNSQQNGLTPFDVDSVPSQVPGQILYIMNLDTGEMDSPTYIPFRQKDAAADVQWGRGYAVFRKKGRVADMELSHFVLPDQPAEVRLLKIRNRGTDPLRLRVVPFIQIMLGEAPVDTRGKIEVQLDRDLGALFFSNPRNEFYRGWAFAATSLPVEAFETVRQRFVGGPNRDLTYPFMVEHGVPDETQPDDGLRIASFVGTLQVPAEGEACVSMVLGQSGDRAQSLEIIKTFKEVAAAEEAFVRTRQWWGRTLSVLQVETHDPAFDQMVNGWLPYQVLAARLWGKLGPNQRSGAYGFRDQIQDVLPFLYLYPHMARRQILLHAAQQFLEGDVFQWWHQTWEGKTGVGVRGRASDTPLWLPYMVSRYVKATGDWAVLDEEAPFLEGRPIKKGVESLMFIPRPSRDTASLYVHCLKAIELAFKRIGAHGLPLLGTGDWNDGLDIAGFKGRGESVWTGFFFHDVLVRFADLAAHKEGPEQKAHYEQKASALRKALSAMWRGDQYVRAITDDGEEMLRIDALTAAWSIISGVADFERGCAAMEAALRELEKENLVQLFTPPYTESDRIYPGRLADYPPGIRENAGQYSHGVSWLVDALLILSEMAKKRGQAEDSRRYLSKAVDLWRKISPLSHLKAEDMAVYGLPPHQQAADVSYGPGYEGRGGWSWYTGGAARMLYAAYGLLGLRMEGGSLLQPLDIHEPRGSLTIKRIVRSHIDKDTFFFLRNVSR